MLLKTAAGRAAFLFLLCGLPLLLASCGLRLDDGSVYPAYETEAFADAPSVSDDDPAECEAGAPPSPPEGGAKKPFLPVRLDPEPNNARAVRAFRRDAPGTRPTPRELREARAMVWAESDLLARGGPRMYRGDGSASTPSGVHYVSAPGALTLDYVASPDLNSGDGLPHALRLVVYHLSDRAELDQLAAHEDGIRKLLEGEFFAESVKGVRVHHVQPGGSGQLLLDRAEGGRYVAVVAGYGMLHASSCVFVAEYGLGQWDMAGETRIHRTKTMFSPLPMHLQAALGDVGLAVRDTGRIYGNMKRVTSLTRQQARHVAVQKPPFPISMFIDG